MIFNYKVPFSLKEKFKKDLDNSVADFKSVIDKRLIILLSFVFLIMIPLITIPSYNQVMTVIKKYNEINRIYETWLIVKSETMKYMLTPPEKEKLLL